MPTSNLATWPAILHMIHEVQPKRVLDVGPGLGKGAVLISEYVGRKPRGPIERIDAIEAHVDYIGPRLTCHYDVVIHGDAAERPAKFFDAYDLVLMADVIEHLDKPRALELLGRIAGYVVICTPEVFFQNPEPITWEHHRSVWTLEDFEATGRMQVGFTQIGGVMVRLGPTDPFFAVPDQ